MCKKEVKIFDGNQISFSLLNYSTIELLPMQEKFYDSDKPDGHKDFLL